MPKLIVDGFGTFEVPAGKRLVNALVDEAGVDQLHACGGFAKCTTCRVQFVSGAPDEMTAAEKEIRMIKGLADAPDIRLSCQIVCDRDMRVKIISRLTGTARKDAGARPADAVEPPAVWTKL